MAGLGSSFEPKRTGGTGMRFTVAETTDAFETPYAVWDSRRNDYLIETDGTVPTFENPEEAELYCLKASRRNPGLP